eukprot:1240018-Amphidinium_carterae.1
MKTSCSPKGHQEEHSKRASFTTQPGERSVDLEAGSLVEGIMATCQGCLAGLAEESWAGVPSSGSRGHYPAEVPKSPELVRVLDYLPREFASSPLGRRAVQSLPLLTASDLEAFLQSPECVAEFGMLRE